MVESNEIIHNVAIEHSQSLETLANIFELNPNAISLTRISDGKIIDCNYAYLNQIGYSRDEVIGYTSLELNLFSFKQRQTYINEIRRKNTITNYEVKVKRKDGSHRYILYSGRFITVGSEKILLSVWHDITKRKKIEQDHQIFLKKVQNERDKLSAIINSIPDEIWFAGPDKKLNLANPSALNEFGSFINDINMEKLISRLEVYRSDSSLRPVDETPILRALKGEIVRNIEEIVRTPSSNEFKSRQVNAAPVKDKNGKTIGAVSVVRDITEQKNIENELKIKEQKYDSLYSTMKEGVAINEIIYNFEKKVVDYLIMDINPSYENIIGFKRSDIVGKRASEVYGTNDPPYLKIYAIVAESGEPAEFETYFESMDKYFRVSVISPEKGKFATRFDDITEHKKAEEALCVSEDKYRSILETSNEGIFIGDTLGIINFANSKMANMLGYSIEELVGTDARSFVDKNELKKVEEKFEERKKGIVDKYELKFRRKNGEPLWTLVKASPIYNQNGIITNILSLYTDITKRVNADEKLKNTMIELERSNKELEQFAYITSHDLREPLRMITSFLQLIERRYKDQLDADVNEFIEYAVDGAKRLDALIQDILIYSKVTKKRQLSKVNFNRIIEKVYINLISSINETDAEITYDLLPTLITDESLMIQLFQNLIANAIKYRSEEKPKIHISAKKEGYQYIFSVKDNGIGISKKYLEKIFTIFQRLHTNEEYEGTGIGLAIAQKIIHQHNGKIWVESEPGKGSTFYFTIPK